MYEKQRLGRSSFVALTLALGASACGGRADLAEAERDGEDTFRADAGALKPLDADEAGTSAAGNGGMPNSVAAADEEADDGATSEDPGSEDSTIPGTGPGSSGASGGASTPGSDPTTSPPASSSTDDADSPGSEAPGPGPNTPVGIPPSNGAPLPPDTPTMEEPPGDDPDVDGPPDVDDVGDPPNNEPPDVGDPPNNEPPDVDEPPDDEPPDVDEPPDNEPPDVDEPPNNEPPKPPLWLATRELPRLVNVHNAQQDVFEVQLAWESDNSRPIASDDGNVAVSFEGEWAHLLQLSNMGTVSTRVELASPTVVGWALGRPLMISESVLYAVSDATNPTPLADVGQFYNGATISPDGREMLFSEYQIDLGFDVLELAVDGSSDTPELLGSGYNSPALSTQWTSDSRFVAYGISSPEAGGIFLWEPGSGGEATLVSAPDAGYSPNYSFSPDAEHVLLHNSGGLRVVNVDDPLMFDTLGSTTASPGQWSPDGQYVYYADDSQGLLLPVSSDTEFGIPIEVGDLDYGCASHWLDNRRMLHRDCTQGGAPLWLVQLGQGSPPTVSTTMLVQDAPSFLAASPDEQCLASWDSGEIRISELEAPTDYVSLRQTASPDFRHLKWAPDSSGVAWVDSGEGVYFQNVTQNITECVPSGDPIRVLSENTSQTIAFLAR